MRKYTNILLGSFAVLFIGLMIMTNLLLKQKVATYNFKDVYRHFAKNEIKQVRHVALELGRVTKKDGEWEQQSWDSMNAHISQEGTQPLLYIHEDMKDSIKWWINGDTLYVKGNNSEQRTRVAVDIILPQLSSISAITTEVEIENIKGDSLHFYGKDHSTVSVRKTTLDQLAMHLDGTDATLDGKNTVLKILRVSNGHQSILKCIDLLPEVFELPTEGDFTLTASGKALGMVKK